ncbi:peptide deformylase [Aminipila butyrica]|uniref:Peptide deformylase n=1 Tax=Aminipila butyrica TaxID=433296 RepID=A0A858BXQ1_9FIRM|nr:peptide deformylase [Aminipila butyrica]QIB69959.1 peptide deformylase [Aminipila butyrica]
MALRNIIVEGDEILRKKCREVTEVDERIRLILDDMLETMRAYNGVGIAAPQVGILKRMFIIEVEEGDVIEMINPEIIETRGAVWEDEGCLSLPGLIGMVERPEYIKIKGLDRFGKEVVHEAEGFKAVAFCHENDHLDGILYTDKAKDVRDAEEE